MGPELILGRIVALVILLLGALLFLDTSESFEQLGHLGKDAFIEFPPTPTSYHSSFHLDDSDYLYVHGHRLIGEIVFEWKVGEAFSLNGYEIIPAIPPPLSVNVPEDWLRDRFGNVPVIRDAVSAGATWKDAYIEWELRRRPISHQLWEAYSESWRKHEDRDLARQAVEIVFRELAADSVLDEGRNLKWDEGFLYVPWRGLDEIVPRLESSMKKPVVPLREEDESDLTYDHVVSYVNSITGIADSEGACLIVIPSEGALQMISAPASGTERFQNEILYQISGSNENEILPGMIRETYVREIVQNRGGAHK